MKYRPSRFLSIDEAMVKYKGRLGFKQYLPLKPVKRGIEVWVRADATNGYVCEFQVYTGKHGNEIEHGLGHRVVSDLVRSLHGKKYHIFCDHFFTSVKLAEDLLENDLYLCGTTRSNRKDFPKQLKPNVAAVKALRRGESLFRRKGDVVATVWKDKKLVSFISTQCQVGGNETVSRKQKDGSIIQVPTVPVVQLYNKYMGGVDLSDQKRQYYESSRRAEKWWRYLLWFSIDVCIVNPHILMMEADNHPDLSQLQFRIELIEGLIGEFTARQRNTAIEGTVQAHHWPVQMSKGRCKRCLKSRKNTFCRMGCELCGIRICLTCFKNHHSANL
ncbi:piggyBac transposable element-derived protein 4-like [Stylophora pistillata]|nr:piggyBac transposable element-derived protein 4-like [Stylophora pistillata]